MNTEWSRPAHREFASASGSLAVMREVNRTQIALSRWWEELRTLLPPDSTSITKPPSPVESSAPSKESTWVGELEVDFWIEMPHNIHMCGHDHYGRQLQFCTFSSGWIECFPDGTQTYGEWIPERENQSANLHASSQFGPLLNGLCQPHYLLNGFKYESHTASTLLDRKVDILICEPIHTPKSIVSSGGEDLPQILLGAEKVQIVRDQETSTILGWSGYIDGHCFENMTVTAIDFDTHIDPAHFSIRPCQ